MLRTEERNKKNYLLSESNPYLYINIAVNRNKR